MDIEKLTQMLKNQGLTDEMVEEVLKNATEQEDTHFNVKEASAYLQDKLGKSWNPAKVRRFIASGELPTINKVDRKGEAGSSTKEGYLISEEDLQTFVSDQARSKNDWKEEALALREEVKALQAKVTSLQERSSTKSSSVVLDLPNDLQKPLNSEGVKPLDESQKPHTEEPEEPKIKGQVELHEVLQEMESEELSQEDISHLLNFHVEVLTKDDALLLLDYILDAHEEFQGKQEELKAKFMDNVFAKTDMVPWFRKEDERYTAVAKKAKRYVFKTPVEAVYNTLVELKKRK